MTLIVCVDDNMGMAFNRRRQSRDRAVMQDIATLAEGKRILMDSRSLPLFKATDGKLCAVDFEEHPDRGELCFVEFCKPSLLANAVSKIILYRWNRHYPADLYFDISLADWRRAEVFEFAGSSHEKITREVYLREN